MEERLYNAAVSFTRELKTGTGMSEKRERVARSESRLTMECIEIWHLYNSISKVRGRLPSLHRT